MTTTSYTRPDGEHVTYSYDGTGLPVEHRFHNAGGTEIFAHDDAKGYKSKRDKWYAEARSQEEAAARAAAEAAAAAAEVPQFNESGVGLVTTAD